MKGTLHLLCGKVASGKTTFARNLEDGGRTILLSVDEWMIRQFGHHMEQAVFETRLRACKELIFDLAERIVRTGVDVVLDFGFWSRAERIALRQRFDANETPYVFYRFDVSEDVLRARARRRNEHPPSNAYVITDEMFDMFGAKFDPPSSDEVFVVISTE